MSLPVWSPTPEHSTDRFNVRWLNEDKDICDVAPQVMRRALDSNRRATSNLGSLSVSESAPDDAIQYLNRLSDALFVWSRWVNHVLGAAEVLWSPNEASSSRRK